MASYDFPIGLDVDRVLTERFPVRGVPAVVLIDDGVVVWRGHPGRLKDDLLRDFLAD